MAKTYTEEEFYNILQAKRKSFRTQKEFAESLELSPQYVSDVMKKRRNVKPLAERLGYEIVFVKKRKEQTK